jgi:hypothetical protein
MVRDLGLVAPGTTLYIPFHTFDSNDPTASVTLTGLATTDIEIYKDGSVTQRASDAGYALLDTDGIDFDSITGIHGISIDLADNTTAGFYAAGSQYWVVIASVTVDAATVNFVLCTFRIGQPGAVLNTTIASLSSQTSFTLTAGPAEDDALNGCVCRLHDVASAVQAGFAVVSDYTGGTKTVTLAAGTTFTAAATDNISFFPPALVPTTFGRTLDVSAGGEAGVDWANVGTPGSTVGLSATTVATVTTTGTATAVTTVNGLAANVITAASMAADASAEIADAVWANGTRSLTTLSGLTVDTVTTLTNLPAITANWLTAAGTAADFTTEVQSGLATAAELAKVPKSDSTVTWNATALASIQSEAEDAIIAHRLDELLNADSDIDGAAPPTVGSVFHELMTKTAGSFTFDQTTDSLEAVRDRGDAAWVTATGFSTHAAADVWAVATRVLTAGTNIQLPSNGLANVTAWTVALTGNVTGNLSGSVGSVTGAINTAAGVITTLDGLDTAQDTQHATTQTAVADVPTNAELTAALGTADDAVLAAIAALNNVSAAAVATAVLTTAMTEAYRSAGATATLAQFAYEVLAHLGESSISGTTKTLKKLDASTTAKTYTLNSATTPTSITETT